MDKSGERLSRMFENPNFSLDEDQQHNEVLVADIRRVMRGALVVIVVFSIVLMFGASLESGLNLLLIAGAPLAGLLASGEFLRMWLRRRDGR